MKRKPANSAAVSRSAPPQWLVNGVWLLGLAAVWSLIALLFRLSGSNTTKFPYLHDIIRWAFSSRYVGAGMWDAIGVTMGIAAKGFVYGFLLGIVLAILMSLYLPVEKVSYPLLLLSQMIPILGLAPIIVSMVGDFSDAKVVMSAYVTFFPIAANMFAGLKAVDMERKEVLMITAASKATIYRKLMLPASLPSLFVGLKIAAPSAFAVVIFTEMLYPQNGGIGAAMLNTQYGNDWELCWGYIFGAVAMSVVLFYAVQFLEKCIVRWKNSD